MTAAPFADLELARRLEALVAEEMRRFVHAARSKDPSCGAECLEVAGGVAVFVAEGSPVNMAVALGFERPVIDDHIEAIERFYIERGSEPTMSVCPLAHPTLTESLGHRGWVVDYYENLLVRDLLARIDIAPPGDVTIIEVECVEEADVWTAVAATAFSAPLDPSPEQMYLCGLVAARSGTRLFLALVDGHPAGTGELFVSNGVGWLSADATLPQFRGRGVQTALQSHRLTAARASGCEFAVSESLPGGVSQRNMQRHGFEVAYTRPTFVAPASRDDVLVRAQ